MAAVACKPMGPAKALKHVVQSKFLWHNDSLALVRSDLILLRKVDESWQQADKIRRFFLVNNMKGPVRPEVKELGFRIHVTSSKPEASATDRKEGAGKQPFHLPEKRDDLDGSQNAFIPAEDSGKCGMKKEVAMILGYPEAKLKSEAFSTDPVPPQSDIVNSICQSCRMGRNPIHEMGEVRTFPSKPNCCGCCSDVDIAEWRCEEQCVFCGCMLCPDCAVVPGSHEHERQ